MKRLIAITAVLLCSHTGLAYDQTVVHSEMTRRAFGAAQAATSFLQRLGLPTNANIGGTQLSAITALGAHDEDNDERPLNHFYDPVHESPLMFANGPLGCLSYGQSGDYTARQWATVAPDNAWGLQGAKDQLRDYLTHPTAVGRQGAEYALFYSLGHVMHLVEDMAQPQHTRNDAHPTSDGLSCLTNPKECWLDELNLWSRYENWCRVNLNVAAFPASSAYYTGYPIVELPSNGAYFKSGNGLGLAEYSNRNFVTEHTNYPSDPCPGWGYDDPAQLAATPRNETHVIETTTYQGDSTVIVTTETYNDIVLSYPTYDAYTNTYTVNKNHSFYSYYNYELKQEGLDEVWSLPESALASQASFLVPRAVGYAAGFLQHFFRGSIDATWQELLPNYYTLTITNTSAESMSNVQPTALYRVATPGTHGAATGEDLVTILDMPAQPITIPSGGSYNFGVSIPSLQPGEKITDFERRIAITATLGSEPGVIIPLVQTAPTRVFLDCWSGSHTMGPFPSVYGPYSVTVYSGLYSNFANGCGPFGGPFVLADGQQFSVAGSGYTTSCTFKGPGDPTAILNRIKVDLYVSPAANSAPDWDLSVYLNGHLIQTWQDGGNAWSCLPGASFETFDMLYDSGTGTSLPFFPGGTNTITITGQLPPGSITFGYETEFIEAAILSLEFQ